MLLSIVIFGVSVGYGNDIWCWCECLMWISIFGVCISVVYSNRYLVLVLVSDMDFDIGCWCECLVWILIFGVGRCVEYANRFLVLVLLSHMDIDI